MARLLPIAFERRYSLEIATVCRGHHVCKEVWKPVIGEHLFCKHDTREEAMRYDDYAVGVYQSADSQQVVGHLPTELSFLLCKFISRQGCSLEFTPTGPRKLEDGLVVPGNFIARCRADKPHAKKLITILKTELDKKKSKLSHMQLDIGEVMLRNKIRHEANCRSHEAY